MKKNDVDFAILNEKRHKKYKGINYMHKKCFK